MLIDLFLEKSADEELEDFMELTACIRELTKELKELRLSLAK